MIFLKHQGDSSIVRSETHSSRPSRAKLTHLPSSPGVGTLEFPCLVAVAESRTSVSPSVPQRSTTCPGCVLRGWPWDSGPVRPGSSLEPGLSDVCPSQQWAQVLILKCLQVLSCRHLLEQRILGRGLLTLSVILRRGASSHLEWDAL